MKIFLLLVFLLTACTLSAQDLIVRKDSTRIEANIYRVNTKAIYFKYWSRGQLADAYIEQENVSYYIMHYRRNPEYVESGKLPQPDHKQHFRDYYKSCLTVGILQGGGSLVGVDFEFLLTNGVGIQLGAGIV